MTCDISLSKNWRGHNQKRYLVTGGCGFIGSHLVDALIAEGHKVVILDNLSTGKIENKHFNASLIIGDTTDYDIVSRAFEGIDGCFHLAAIASVEKSRINWAETHKVNLTSTINIFQVASKLEKKVPVIYTSSAAVYGDCHIMPISEEVPPSPLTAYGADKLACDLNGRIAWEGHGVPNIGMRPFNVYGPRQDPSSPYSGVISIFTDRMTRGESVTIYGDGEQVRDFVYVGDAVKAFIAAMECLQDQKTSGHDVINICTGRAISIKDLADTIENIVGCHLPRRHEPPRKGDIRVSVGSPDRLISRLGVVPDVLLEDGLRMTMNNVQHEMRWAV